MWQPIETAPKDGDLILAASPTSTKFLGYFVVYWSHQYQQWLYSRGREAKNITHWMPLPPPPTSELI